METVKEFEFRELNADDVFLMVGIISKIGLNEFADCFGKEHVQKIVESITNTEDENAANALFSTAGVALVLEAANVILGKMNLVRDDIIHLLAATSNLTEKDIHKMSAVKFVKMVIAFFKKKEFPDFFGAVMELFK